MKTNRFGNSITITSANSISMLLNCMVFPLFLLPLFFDLLRFSPGALFIIKQTNQVLRTTMLGSPIGSYSFTSEQLNKKLLELEKEMDTILSFPVKQVQWNFLYWI